MSHFSVLVISKEEPTSDVLDRLLAPFHEFECTGIDDQYVVDVDKTLEALEKYNNDTMKMVAAPDGVTFYGAYDDRFYRDPTPEETKKIGPIPGSGGGHGMRWFSKDWGDGHGYRAKVRAVPADHKEIDVPTRDIETIAQWIEGYYGTKAITVRAGESDIAVQARLDRNKEHKYGYALVDENGALIKLVDRTNPGKRWDWWQLGGRFTGKFKPHYDPAADPDNRETCFLCNGTGKRRAVDVDAINILHTIVDKGCNGCDGTGVRTKWPTQWKSVGDVVQVKDLPLEALRNIAESAALAQYDKAIKVIAGRPIPSWSETRERLTDIDAARNEFNNDPVIVDLKANGFEAFWDFDALLEGFRQTRAEHATRARRRAVQTFAVLKDGKWYEQGSMGWWGMVSDKKDADAWDEEFAALLDGLPPEMWLAVVDCHI